MFAPRLALLSAMNARAMLAFGLLLLAVGAQADELPVATLQATPAQIESLPAEVSLTLTIPANHHAYMDEGDDGLYIPVGVDTDTLASGGIEATVLQAPKGVRDDEVKAVVLRGTAIFKLSLAAQPGKTVAAGDFAIPVNIQMCNDRSHVCYMPDMVEAHVTLTNAASNGSASSSVAPPITAEEEDIPLMTRLTNLYQENAQNIWFSFFLMLVAGLLSTATPCVYPMLPITSAILMQRGGGDRKAGLRHALTYAVGIILTYFLLGLIAGLTGGALNTLMQSAWVNLGFGLFFAFFGLALLGFYEMAILQDKTGELDQKSEQVGGLFGTLMMGMVAGLVISPCVGPIVFALLLQVADAIAQLANAAAAAGQVLSFWDQFAISLKGGLMMAGFGVGIGVPFFIVGRPGTWMEKVKYGFGLLILYFGYIYFSKGMGVAGVEEGVTLGIVVGLVALWIAIVHMNVFAKVEDDAMPQDKLRKFGGVVVGLIGAYYLVAGFAQSGLILPKPQPMVVAGAAGAQGDIEEHDGILWHRTIEGALAEAKKTGKPIFIDFYAAWCANCKEFAHQAGSDPVLRQILNQDAVPLRLVDKEADFLRFQNDPQYRELKTGLPFFVVLDPNGNFVWKGTDYKAVALMRDAVARAAGH